MASDGDSVSRCGGAQFDRITRAGGTAYGARVTSYFHGCALVVAACTPGVGPIADASAPVAHDRVLRLPPQVVVESSWESRVGDQMSLELSAQTADLDWSLHTHDGNSTQVVIAEFGIAHTTYAFAAWKDSTWFVSVRNRAMVPLDVATHIELVGGAGWQDWP